MRLTRVTITGADDDVEPAQLGNLSRRYPFVEWGILFSKTREGQPRYPSFKWRQSLEQVWEQNRAMNLSAHLCGELARQTLAGREEWIGRVESTPYVRVQLNGFGRSAYDGIVGLMHTYLTRQWILQVYDDDTLAMACNLCRVRGGSHRFVILFDASGGTGTAPKKWPAPPNTWHIAYSGGITPENFASVVEGLSVLRPPGALSSPVPDTFGVDLETGARTGDKFDLEKVALILEQATHLVGVSRT